MTITEKHCDRCGNELGKDAGYWMGGEMNLSFAYNPAMEEFTQIERKWDLCLTCISSFIGWIGESNIAGLERAK